MSELSSDRRSLNGMEIVILAPVYNDWEALRLLLPALDTTLAEAGVSARLLIVDDGSNESPPADLSAGTQAAIRSVRVVRLRRNLGHQRALAIGLALVDREMACDAVVVMDSDGEDMPSDIPRLLERMQAAGGSQIVFAQRMRRSEGLIFSLFYRGYRILHRMLTGIPVQVGNFSAVPRAGLHRLVVVSDLWNHYAAAVFQSRIPYVMLPTSRGRRLQGQSRMNFVGLVGHGLSAISVFSDRVGVRLLIATLCALLAALLGLAIIAVAWATGALTIGTGSIVVVGLALFFLLQLCLGAGLFVLLIHFGRAGVSFIPSRDYRHFLLADETPSLRD